VPTAQPHRAARERGSERARVCADRRGPPVRHRGRAGAGTRARAALNGWLGPKWLFPGISVSFSIIFSRVFNSNSN
jgi:hypothetical protein